jgi:predicted phage tail protein
MKVVKVYGALRKRLGQCRFEFDVNTPAQAIKALCVNFPGLERWLIDSEQDGVGYRVRIGKEVVKEEDMTPLVMPFSEKEVFTITPVVVGAGGDRQGFGFGQILIGAALIGASFIPGVGAFAVAAMQTIGTSLVLNGVATLISPQPTVPDLEEAAQLESFTVSNVVNTQKQGLPVPLAYGRVFVGSAVLSSGLDVDQVQV